MTMNAETAKLLRKAARLTNSRYRVLKRGWERLPYEERGEFKKKLKRAIEKKEKENKG